MVSRSRWWRIPLTGLTIIILIAAAGGLRAADNGDGKGEDGDKKAEGLPLEPQRTIEFTTDEGTWLSLDVSPDGGTIVFDLLGDLYTVPFRGGTATRLTSGLPMDAQPRYSPDGKWIAFTSDRDGAENVWIIRADGTEPKQLSRDKQNIFASPTWTPDGQFVIVSRSSWALSTYELWMYHVQGGTGVQLTKAKPSPQTPRNQRHNALGASIDPDGRYLYYARKTGGFQYNATFPMWQIARRDMNTGDEDVLTEAPGSAIRPLISPDGATLVYGTRLENRSGLRIRDLHSGEDRWLHYPVQRDDQESRFTRDLLPGYAFTPDGNEIVVSYGGRIHRIDVATGKSRPVPFTAKIEQGLGPRLYFPLRVEGGPVRARIIQDPAESPDGGRLAFSALTKLYIMNIPGGTPRRLTDMDRREFQPAWSPDGIWIAYVTWTTDGGSIWKVRADGRGVPKRLTRVPAFYTDPVWTPDGTRIIALRGSAFERTHRTFDFGEVPGRDLIWIPADGGDARLIVPSRGLGKPHFTDDPDRIFLYTDQGPYFLGNQKQSLLSFKLDGTDRREHISITGPGIYFNEDPVPAEDIRIRPDGKWALARVGNQLWVTAVPRIGGEAATVNIGSPSVPAVKLTTVGADYFGWADGGDTMTWSIGSTYFRRPFDSVSFQKPEPSEGEEEEADDDGGAPGTGKPEAEEADENTDKIKVVLEFPRSIPTGVIALRGATVITMNGDEIIQDADLVVTDNRITGIGPRGMVEIPARARIFDVKGETIVPGFVDTHAHWFEIRRGILDVQNWSFLANLAYGVTTGLDVQTATNDMFAYQDLVDTGEILGLRAYSTGPGIFSNNNFQSMEEAEGVISRYKDFYRTRHLKSYVVGNRRQQEFVAQASWKLGMMPTTEGGLDLKLDLTHALDGFRGNEHALPIVPLFRDVIQLFARSEIGYTPTLIVSYGGPWAENYFYTTTEVHDDPKLNHFTPHEIIDAKAKRVPWFREDEQVFPKLAAEAAKIAAAGGYVGIGSHGQLQGLGYHWEMWALASGGMSNHDVLRAATRHGAEMIGYGQDLGSLEPGKLADLVVLDGNPLDDIHNTNTVRYVMKNGELFEGDTLNEVWPKRKALGPLWWLEEDQPAGGE